MRRHSRLLGAGIAAVGLSITIVGCSSSEDQPGVAVSPSTAVSGSVAPDSSSGQVELAPVTLKKAATYPNGVAVKLAGISRTTLEAKGPGEVSGPGITVQVQVTNGSGQEIVVDGTTVNLFYGKAKNPAAPASTSDKPISGPVAVGGSADGVYNFSVPASGNPIEVVVSYSAAEPVAVFAGNL